MVTTRLLPNCDIFFCFGFHSNCKDGKKQRSRMRIQDHTAAARSRLASKSKVKHTFSTIQVKPSSITKHIIPESNASRQEQVLHRNKFDRHTAQLPTVATKVRMSQAVDQQSNGRGSQRVTEETLESESAHP